MQSTIKEKKTRFCFNQNSTFKKKIKTAHNRKKNTNHVHVPNTSKGSNKKRNNKLSEAGRSLCLSKTNKAKQSKVKLGEGCSLYAHQIFKQ